MDGRIWLAAGAGLLAIAGWQAHANAYNWFGLIPPGECVVDGRQLPIAEAAPAAAGKLHQPAAVACAFWPAGSGGDAALTELGLTPAAAAMLTAVRAEFGQVPVGGYDPEGVTTGHIKGSAHYEGRAVDFFFRPHTKRAEQKAGWRLANWAVLQADALDIRTIIYRDRIWTRNNSVSGWRDYTHPSGNRQNPILRHLDHVHIDVG